MDKISTRKSYGLAITELGRQNDQIFVLDAETSNSTFADLFKKEFPDRFVESFIAEQNMISMATGLAKMGKIPFASTFAAFFARGFDQIRMAGYSQTHLNLVGSHCGVSIGPDGTSQMGLEDIAIFRSVFDSTVLYPADFVATQKLVQQMANHRGVNYLRTTRADLEPIYEPNEEFPIGGSKTLHQSQNDQVTLISAGITLFEALKAYQYFQAKNINLRVIDLYSIKPLDYQTISKASQQTQAIVVIEDHYVQGGIFEAVASSLASSGSAKPIFSLAVTKMPRSGTPEELLEYEEIDAKAIIAKVEKVLNSQV